MKANKRIMTAIAAISMLSAATGVTAFASNLAKNDPKPEKETVISQDAEEATEEAAEEATEEAAEEAPAAEDAEAPVAEDAEAPAVEDAEAPAVEDAEAPAVEEAEKPEKPVGKHEIVDMIGASFDFDAEDFKDADAKTSWFEFCKGGLKKDLEKPAKPEKPAVEPPKPVEKADEEIEKPAKPEKPAVEPPKPAEKADEEIEKPAKPEKPAVEPPKPIENGEKPEPPVPPVKPEVEPPKPHLHEGPKAPEQEAAETVEAETEAVEAE